MENFSNEHLYLVAIFHCGIRGYISSKTFISHPSSSPGFLIPWAWGAERAHTRLFVPSVEKPLMKTIAELLIPTVRGRVPNTWWRKKKTTVCLEKESHALLHSGQSLNTSIISLIGKQ